MQRNQKLRLLLFAPEKSPSGGIAAWTQRLKKHLDYNKIDMRIIDTSKLYDPLGKSLGVLGALCGCRDMLRNGFMLLRALWVFRPEVVYFTCAPSIGYIVRDVLYMHLLRLLRVPYVVHFRGGKMTYFFGRNWLERVYIRIALKHARALIVITRDIEKKARDMFDKDRIVYIPNMIEDSVVLGVPKKNIEDRRSLAAIHVAWQAIDKGTLDIIDALPLIRSSTKFEMIGELAEENKRLFEQRVAHNKIGDRIAFLGVLKGMELERKYLDADIFVLPSHSEGFPNVILEAMAYGLPVIATNVGNIGEMIGAGSDNAVGLLLENVNPVSADELACCIDKLADNVELRRQMSQNGQQRVKDHYMASRIIPQLEELLFRVCYGETA